MRERVGQGGGSEKNVAVLSNMTLEPYFFDSLIDIGASEDIKLHLFDLCCADLSEETGIRAIGAAQYLLVMIRLQELYPLAYEKLFEGKKNSLELAKDILDFFHDLLKKIRRIYSGPVIWTSLEDVDTPYAQYLGDIFLGDGFLDSVNASLGELFYEDGRSVFLDIKRLIARVGVTEAYSFKNFYRWNAPYSKKMSCELAAAFWKQTKILEGKTPKCLVLDCDNVLWGGVLSEDGLENIKLGNIGYGKIYQDFQRFLLSLWSHGVLLAICSKNDFVDVEKVFATHSGMILKDEHIACYRVNWNRKDRNLMEIAQEMNLSLDAMVFIDDSLFEINLIKKSLPEVRTIHFRPETPYAGFSVFNLRVPEDREEVYRRNRTYKTDSQRRALAAASEDYEEYLAALDMEIEIKAADHTELQRIAELSARTNQCTNGKRYRTADLAALQRDGYRLYAVYLKDRFSDLGLVGGIGIMDSVLDLFCLSCRALGRKIEEKMFDFIRAFPIREIYCSDTGKNSAFLAWMREAFDGVKLEGGK